MLLKLVVEDLTLKHQSGYNLSQQVYTINYAWHNLSKDVTASVTADGKLAHMLTEVITVGCLLLCNRKQTDSSEQILFDRFSNQHSSTAVLSGLIVAHINNNMLLTYIPLLDSGQVYAKYRAQYESLPYRPLLPFLSPVVLEISVSRSRHQTIIRHWRRINWAITLIEGGA